MFNFRKGSGCPSKFGWYSNLSVNPFSLRYLDLFQLHYLASDYSANNLQTTPDENRNNLDTSKRSPSAPADGVDVYVWGSNSTHQLAEGNQEKILAPKLSPAFKDCPEVNTHQPLYNMVCYNTVHYTMVLNITQISAGPLKVI